MKMFENHISVILEDWCRTFVPAEITVCDPAAGEQFREPSLVAARIRRVSQTGEDPVTGEERTLTHTAVTGYLAAGAAAREYMGQPDVAVFSPLRDGQIAQYDAAEYLFRELLARVSPKLRLVKPVLCLRVQEHTTQVEERAMVDAGIQCGARRVYLYQEPLEAILRAAAVQKRLRGALILHIETRG